MLAIPANGAWPTRLGDINRAGHALLTTPNVTRHPYVSVITQPRQAAMVFLFMIALTQNTDITYY